MNLNKTKNDINKEKKDLSKNAILRYLLNKDRYKFNIGDILIKRVRTYDDEGKDKFETETDTIGAPIKYVYAFENELGIGYVKKLRKDGKGPVRTQPILIATTSLDNEYFQLDPDYADYLLLGGEGEFNYNESYERISEYRKQAIKNNKDNATKLTNKKQAREWWKSLKVGDKFWHTQVDSGEDPQEWTGWKVIGIGKGSRNISFKIIDSTWEWEIGETTTGGLSFLYDDDCRHTWDYYVSDTKPLPLQENRSL